MDCQTTRDRLSALLDGELSGARRRRLERHLESCRRCREEMERLRQVTDALEMLPGRPVPPGLASRVMARARRTPASSWPRAPRRHLPSHVRPGLRRAAGVAAVLLVMVAATVSGILMGRAISGSAGAGEAPGEPTAVQRTGAETVDWFGAAPPVSLSRAYLVTGPSSATTGGAR